MAKTVWALDLGEWSLKIARARGYDKEGKITVDLVDVIRYSDLPCGYEAHVTERYQEGLRAFMERHKVQKGDRVCVSVTGHEVFNRFIHLPPVPMKRVAEIAPYEARQQIPFNIDEVVWDYQPVKTEFDVGEEIEIGLFAIKRDRVSEFMEMLEPVRSNLYCIQAAPLAVYNFLHHEEMTQEPMIVLDIGAHSTDLLVLDDPKFWLRCVLVAGDNLTMAIQQKFNVSKEEAETIKERAGGSKHSRQIYEVVRPVVRNIVSEVQRSLGYYKSIASEVKFSKILGLGGSFKLSGMDRLVGESMQYEIVELDSFNKFDFTQSVDQSVLQEHRNSLCVTLGLLAQGYDAGRMEINLLPYEVVKETMIRKKKPFLLAGSIALLIISILLYFGNRIMAAELRGSETSGKSTIEEVRQFRQRHSEKEGQLNRTVSPIQVLMEPDFDWEKLPDPQDPAIRGVRDALEMGWERYMWVQIFPSLAGTIPKDQIFVSSLRTDWLTDAEIEKKIQAGRPKEKEARRNPWEQMERPPGDMPGGEQQPQEGEEKEKQAAAGVEKSQDTRMVALIDGESLSEMQGFIESDFIEKLRAFKLEGIPVPIFKRVEMLGTPEILYRHPIDGNRVNNPDPGGVKHQLPGGIIIRMQYERYLRFAALAALKTDKEILEDIEKWQEERKKADSASGTPGAGTQ